MTEVTDDKGRIESSSRPNTRPGRSNRATRYLRSIMLLLALLLPMLSLVVLGSVWLWQNGYLLYWAGAALIVTLLFFAAESWLLRDAVGRASRSHEPGEVPPDLITDREIAAWNAVMKLARDTNPDTITSRDTLIELGKSTVEIVARQMHPDDKSPLLKFTLPELLGLISRVSRDMGPFVRDSIPLGDRLTVAQVLAIYRWRGAIDVADKVYDIWRIVRLMNPATAVAQEVRERITRQIYDWGRSEVARKLTTAYIRNVGRAAIDLYSGRMRALEVDDVGPIADIEPAPSPEPAPSTKRSKPYFSTVRRVFSQARKAGALVLRRNDDEKLR